KEVAGVEDNSLREINYLGERSTICAKGQRSGGNCYLAKPDGSPLSARKPASPCRRRKIANP
ncbi:hypothetical protein ABC473_08475, partial [Brucella abortus]|uniref:hypothetical protein n=1 Tax=Brucella abortus TaxID=235 RepID=UPI0031FD608C